MTGGPHPPNAMLKVVACIPAFNEESSIGAVVVRASGYVDGVLVCGDGSRGLMGAMAEAVGAVVRHERNRVV